MTPLPAMRKPAALVFRNSAVVSRFRHAERQREAPYDEAWFQSQGFTLLPAPPGVNFEGAGDALFCGDTLYAGYRIRRDTRGHQQIGQLLGVRVIPLELVDPYFYHLDTCFCPLAPGEAIYYPPAFDAYALRVLANMIDELIPVSESEARRFACNADVVGRTVVTNSGCPELHQALALRGYTPRKTLLDEFVKSGGSAKCLTCGSTAKKPRAGRIKSRMTIDPLPQHPFQQVSGDLLHASIRTVRPAVVRKRQHVTGGLERPWDQ